ncbi:hypothetical protein A2W14_02950 [Candidatus Gottesmanbacteria bacterium RBG_16_37_8]|uniref:Uncharacterized protein n=1 Tax=Candidatus Gottesmanbacteria bacterium RBG_16_37_8 TaxID=1798371 RepID=A0A1F5YRF2_9BACT|nr:MAG: hypothetical protein A2W14_02950 [Candidatus Gottesmanbacteria bacterium RBG_16_37_8]
MIFVQKKITSKEDALLFIRNFTGFLQTLLLDRNSSPLLTPVESAGLIRKVTTARQFLDNNVNYKLVLDILLLGLPFCKR